MSFLVLVYVILPIMTFLVVMVLLLIPHMFTIQIPPSLFLYYLPIKKRKHLILRENIRRQKGFFFFANNMIPRRPLCKTKFLKILMLYLVFVIVYTMIN